ncbi:MAG: RluA family pseudouridine synthase [Clostridiales bacterium]|nr:RluA family pseudouridine synthase [Clostridiales bacterium]
MEKLTVLYEDNQIVVVIKPQNVPSMPDESKDQDLLSMVKSYVKEKYQKPGDAFIGLVHRLDRPTGGIMVFARNSKSAERLSKQFQEHSVEKEYYAVVNGVVKVKSQKLTNYLKKDTKENIVKIVPMSEQGVKKAELVYNLLAENDKESLLKVNILTGRSHQIRVQLANIGHSLVGDVKYGKAKGTTSKLGLWAGKLTFEHPKTKERMVFVAYPDETVSPWNKFDMGKYIKQ